MPPRTRRCAGRGPGPARDEAADALRARASEQGVEVDVRALDVTDVAQARDLVAALATELGGIDVLVNNAGAGFVGSLEQTSDDDLRHVLETNFFSVATMTRLVLPGQRARLSGRIVTVTSVGGVVGQPFNDAYCAAKFAAEGLLESLAPVASTFGVHVSVVEPGRVASEFLATATASAEAMQDAGEDYTVPFASYLERARTSFAGAQQPAEVAAVVVQAATEDEPRFRYQTSDLSRGFVGLKLGDLDGGAVVGATTTWIT